MNLIISLLNTLAIVATLGLLIFSKLLYKKPKITEESEKKHLAIVYASPKPPSIPDWIKFEPITVNIAPTPPDTPEIKGSGAAADRGNLHYVTTGFSLEVGDRNNLDMIEAARPFILDQIITLLGKKKPQELTTVQGRYILKSQLLEILNKKIAELSHNRLENPVVIDLFFEQFTVQ